MSSTHDYDTKNVKGSELDSTMTLIGDSGGLSSIYEVSPSNTMPGLLMVETEHGSLYLDPDEEFPVLDYPPDKDVYTEPAATTPQPTTPLTTTPLPADGKKIMATFNPQLIDSRDNAVDVPGSYQFDVTDQILAMGREAALKLTDSSQKSDDLWYSAVSNLVAPVGIMGAHHAKDWDGPFFIWVETAIQNYYDDIDDAEAARAARHV